MPTPHLHRPQRGDPPAAQLHDRPRRRGWRLIAGGLAAVAGACAVAAPAVAHGDGATVARLQQAVDDVVAAGAPGAAVLVRDGDRSVRLASGLGRIQPPAPMRGHDRTRIGGVTKSFTATVVLQLAAEGRLRLGDRVERWLPGTLVNGGAITIRQLLNHTSGVFNCSMDPRVVAPYEAGDLTHVSDPALCLQVAAEHGPQFAPGTRLDYSNTNFLLLSMIAERATGRPFADELRSRIFIPLGLRHTSYETRSEIAGAHTHGYVLSDDGPFEVTALSPSLFGPAGAILSNADDLARFYRALLRGGLLPAPLLQAMRTVDPVATGGVPDVGILGGGWGLGLLREQFPCGTAWGHDAENPGYMTAAWSDGDGARQVVVVVNTHQDHDGPVSAAMRDLLTLAYCG